MTRSQRQALRALYLHALTDDGWMNCRNGGGKTVSPLSISALAERGYAQYLPGHDSRDHVYARITLAGIAALRIGMKEAA